jgi:hypothetical protein
MDKQAVFNKVWAHAQTMTEKSRIGGRGCLYQHPDGNRCFVGALIDDEATRKHYDTLGGVTDIPPVFLIVSLSRYAPEETFLRSEDLDFLQNLQEIHDENAMEDWESELIKVADYHGLSLPGPWVSPDIKDDENESQ